MEAVLSIAGLSKSFGSTQVTNNVSLALPPGARHALIGPNGAGKTTLVNQLTGVLKPNAGTITLLGRDVTKISPERRVALGMARTFQINSLFDSLTVGENLALAVAANRGMDHRPWGRINADRSVTNAVHVQLERLDLVSLTHRPIQNLAYGQRRLVEIALALALKPRVLLLDEPAAGVSAKESQLVLDVLMRLPADVAILIIEHDMDLVFRFAKRISVLVQGSILTEGAPEDIQRDERVRDIYLGRRHA